jgi:hypothetical protein
MRAKKDFDMAVYLHSNTADKFGYMEQYRPDMQIKANLRMIHEMVVVPLLENLPTGYWINITCSYRCRKVNDKLKGAKNSQHLCSGTDAAIDIECYNEKEVESNDTIINIINQQELKFTQLIREKGKNGWIHIGYDAYDLKNQKLIID